MVDFLAAEIATHLAVDCPYDDWSQLLEGELVRQSWAHHVLVFWFELFGTIGRLFDRPERSLSVVLLVWVYLILANRLNFKVVLFHFLLPMRKVLANPQICEVLILLEHIQLLCLFDEFFLLCYLSFALNFLFVCSILALFLLFLLNQVLQNAGLAEYMPLIADHGLVDLLHAQRTHIERLLRVLSNALLDCAVQAFEHLPLAVSEDVRAGVIL